MIMSNGTPGKPWRDFLANQHTPQTWCNTDRSKIYVTYRQKMRACHNQDGDRLRPNSNCPQPPGSCKPTPTPSPDTGPTPIHLNIHNNKARHSIFFCEHHGHIASPPSSSTPTQLPPTNNYHIILYTIPSIHTLNRRKNKKNTKKTTSPCALIQYAAHYFFFFPHF